MPPLKEIPKPLVYKMNTAANLNFAQAHMDNPEAY